MQLPSPKRALSFARATCLAGLLGVLSFSVWGDDRYDISMYGGLGGVMPVKNDAYRSVCGACHFTYAPGLLPARSWELLMSKTDNHFGKNLGLAPDVLASVKSYLVDNAADRSKYLGSQQIITGLSPSVTPLRITQLPEMVRKHRVVSSIRTSVKSLTNCNDCHLHPEQGMFATDDYIIPGTNPGMGPDMHNAEKPPTG